MVLVCVLLMISESEHLFICLLIICISSLENCLFKSFAQFLIGPFGYFFVHLFFFLFFIVNL